MTFQIGYGGWRGLNRGDRLNASFFPQLIQQLVDIMTGDESGQFLPAAFAVNEHQQASLQWPQSQRTGLDFLLTDSSLGKDNTGQIEGNIGHRKSFFGNVFFALPM